VTLSPELALRLEFGRQVLGQLSTLVRDRFLQGRSADVESEQLFRSEVGRSFPEDPVEGEELGSDPGAEQDGWLIDPLDGSTNHGQGIPLFAVSIAYRIAGTAMLGWVSDPMRGEWFEAVLGQGLDSGGNVPTSATSHQPPIICLSPRWRGVHCCWRDHLPRGIKQRSFGTIALEMAWIATGRLQAGAWYRTHPWDVCAGELLIRESGGEVIDVTGGGPGEKIARAAGATALLESLQATIAAGGKDAPNSDPV